MLHCLRVEVRGNGERIRRNQIFDRWENFVISPCGSINCLTILAEEKKSQICGMSFGEQQRRHLLRVLFANVKYYSEWLLVGKVVCNSGSSTSFIRTRTIHSCYELDRAHFNHFMVFPFIFYFLFIPSPEH